MLLLLLLLLLLLAISERMDLGEKTMVLNGDNPGVPRLGIPALAGGDELHGAGGCGAMHGNNTGCGTSFPHALALAATFNRSLWRQVGDAISTENRALTNQGLSGMLNPWDPDINLVRDPRWGRNQGRFEIDYLDIVIRRPHRMCTLL